MPSVKPSDVVQAVDMLFGGNRNELASGSIRHFHRAEVHTILALLDEIPPVLLDLGASDYVEFCRCKAVLATSVAQWNLGDIGVVRDVGGKDPIERIRRLLRTCPDELPRIAPELAFIDDAMERASIEDTIASAWRGFETQEWMGATVLSGTALEMLLLWALMHTELKQPQKRPLEQLFLSDLIKLARDENLISEDCTSQAVLAQDARNLIHPGKALRSGKKCSKATALTTLASVFAVAEQLAAGQN